MPPAAPSILIVDLALIAAIAAGLGLALGARGLIKRALGLFFAQAAAAVALAAVGVDERAALAALIAATAALLLGLALAVRLREAYGAAELDAADAEDDAEDVAERAA